MKTVAGEIVIPDGAPNAGAVRAAVRVRDITFSDAPAAEPVATQDLILDVAPGAHLDFSVDVPDDAIDRVAAGELELNLEVHVDFDGSGTFSVGDFVSLTAQPIGPDTVNPVIVDVVMV